MEFFFLFLNRWSSERNVKLYIAELRRRKAKANYNLSSKKQNLTKRINRTHPKYNNV